MRVLWAGLIATLLGIAGCAPRNGPALVRPLSFPEPSYANLDDATHQALRQAWDAAQKNSTDSATGTGEFRVALLWGRRATAGGPRGRSARNVETRAGQEIELRSPRNPHRRRDAGRGPRRRSAKSLHDDLDGSSECAARTPHAGRRVRKVGTDRQGGR